MLTAYLICLIAGGVFVGLSMFAGADHDTNHDVDHGLDHDVDHDLDHDVDHDLDHDVDHDLDADGDCDVAHDVNVDADVANPDIQALWLPFFSFKFWTFATCFFGLTGTLLTLLKLAHSQLVIVPISVVIGLAAGTAMAYLLRKLKQDVVDSMVRKKDLVGATGVVELSFGKERKGKVLVEVKGQKIIYLAETDEDRPLERDEPVLVLGMEGNVIKVVRTEGLLTSGDSNAH